MPRIGIMTFLHNNNYGSTLQAWALQTALRDMGMDAEHIDYRPDSREKLTNLLRCGNSPALLLDGLRKRVVRMTQTGAREKAAAFSAFYREQMRVSGVCRRHAELEALAAHYDLLLCGSDQIWSPVWLNPAYFLDFAGDKPRVAYAASLGVEAMPCRSKTRRMAGLIAPFDAVSVREEEGARLVERIAGRHADVMPDPVCLIGRERWLRLAQERAYDGKYIACYFIGDRPDYWQQVRRLQEEMRCGVVVIPVTDGAYRQPYTLAEGLSPQAWLGTLGGAEHVVTDSFHGALFACVLGRRLTLLRRYREDDPESKNSRIDQLMRTLRIPPNDTEMDMEAVSARLADERERGLAWLHQAISQATR